MESNLAPLIDQAMHDNPHVYIKSHPSMLKKEIELNFSTTTKSSKTAETRINKTMAQLSRLIKEKDGKIKSAKNDQ